MRRLETAPELRRYPVAQHPYDADACFVRVGERFFETREVPVEYVACLVPSLVEAPENHRVIHPPGSKAAKRHGLAIVRDAPADRTPRTGGAKRQGR